MNDKRRAAEDCLKAAKLLYARGMVNAYEGNVSVRLGDTILITPSAVCKEELSPEDLVEVRVPIADRVGVLSQIVTLAADLGVSIFDIEIAHSSEGPQGVLILVIEQARSERLQG